VASSSSTDIFKMDFAKKKRHLQNGLMVCEICLCIFSCLKLIHLLFSTAHLLSGSTGKGKFSLSSLLAAALYFLNGYMLILWFGLTCSHLNMLDSHVCFLVPYIAAYVIFRFMHLL
jgi:hypothetical protein